MSLGPAALWMAGGIQQIWRLQADKQTSRQAGRWEGTAAGPQREQARGQSTPGGGSMLLLLIVPLVASYSCLDAA